MVVAIWQNIAYEEFLQVVLGRTAFREHLLGADQGFYNPRICPDVANEVATAAFRFGHTFIPDILQFTDRTFQTTKERELPDVSTA